MNILDGVDNKKHIAIVAKADGLYCASAIYSHLLRLHKKVSFVCFADNISQKLSFLPWFDKIRKVKPTSADLVIEIDCNSQELYDFFIKSDIKINSKIATALYGGLLKDTENLMNHRVNGITFATMHKLVEFGAEYQTANRYAKRVELSSLRLKSIMLKKMLLQNSAKVATFLLCDDDLKASGASVADCDEILKEALTLATVEFTVLLDADNDYEALKIIYKEI